MFPKNMYIGTLDRDILKPNTTLKKGRKHIISKFGIQIMWTSQYGIPIINNPILL
jgi:hypothetical protein